MLPASMGPMMLLATLEETIQQLLREKIDLQTELELLKAGFTTPTSHCNFHFGQQQLQQQGNLATADPFLGISSYSSGAAADVTLGAGGAPMCSAASFLELQQLVQQLQHENAAVKASLAELLQADDQEFARLHAMLADRALIGVAGASRDNWHDGSSPRQHGTDDGVAGPRAAAAAEAGAEAAGLQLFDLRGVENADKCPPPNAAAAAAILAEGPAAAEGTTATHEHHHSAIDNEKAQQQLPNATQQPAELVSMPGHPATHQSSRSSRHPMLSLIHQQQVLLIQLQRLCQQRQQQEGSGSDPGPDGSGSHLLLQQAQQQAAALSCTLTDIRHEIVTSPGFVLPDAAAPCAAAAAGTAAAAADGGGGGARGTHDGLELSVPQLLQQQQQQQPQQQPQQPQQQQQQQLPPEEQQLPAVQLQPEDASASALLYISANVAAAAANDSGPSSIDAAAAAAAAAGGGGSDLATAMHVDTIDLRDLQQQQQQAVAELDSDELDALLANTDQQQLLPAAVKFDSAGNLISPDAAATAAEAIAAVQQQPQQQHCCALCCEQFPSAAAFWAHCVMPHHVLLLLVRQQQLQGTGLLGLPAFPGWWRRSLQLLPQITAAAAAGCDSNSMGPTTRTSHSSSRTHTQQQVSGDAAVGCAAASGACAAADLTCCDEQITTELQLVKHYLSSNHLHNVTTAVTAAAEQAGISNGSRFTPDCCEHIRQLASALITSWTAADGVTKALKLQITPSLPPAASAATSPAAGRPQTKQAPAASNRARLQQQQQLDPLSQESAYEVLLLLDSYTASVESYLSGFDALETASLLPVPVPQGAAQALDLLFQCYKQQVTIFVTCATDLRGPAQMPEPGPAMRVWMNPGVYVLPFELLLLLEHEPAAAAAASVMLGVQQVLPEQQQQKQKGCNVSQQQQQQQVLPEQQQQQGRTVLQQQQQQNPDGAQQQHRQQSQQRCSARQGSLLPQQQQSQQRSSAGQKNNSRKVAAAAASNDRPVAPPTAAQAGVAAEGSKQTSRRPKRQLHHPPAGPVDAGGAIADPAVEAAASGGEIDTAAAAADEKASKRRKHAPIPRPPAIETRPAAAAAAGATGGSAGSSPSAAVAAAAAGGGGSIPARGNNLGSGFVQRGNKTSTLNLTAARSTLPSPHSWQQQQQLQGLGSSRAHLQGPTSITADRTSPAAPLPPPALSMVAPARSIGDTGGRSGQQLAGASGGMLSGGYRAQVAAAVGFARPPIQQYEAQYADQARIQDLDLYRPGQSLVLHPGGFSHPASYWEGDYYSDSGMGMQQQHGQGSRGGSGRGLRGGLHHLHPGMGDGLTRFHGHRGRGGW